MFINSIKDGFLILQARGAKYSPCPKELPQEQANLKEKFIICTKSKGKNSFSVTEQDRFSSVSFSVIFLIAVRV